MMTVNWTFLVITILFLFISNVNLLQLKSQLDTNTDWKFIGRFCFLPDVGRIDFKLRYPINYEFFNLTFYYDDQWNKVYGKSGMSCYAKQRIGQSIQMTFKKPWYNTDCKLVDNGTYMECNSYRLITGVRSYWWFIVLDRCAPPNNTNPGLKIEYELSLTNGKSIFTKEFSSDEMGVYEMTIAMCAVYIIVLIIASIFAKILSNKKLFHTTFKVFIVSVVIQLASFILLVIESASFAQSGVHTGGFGLVGRLLDYTAQTIFFIMLILIAKGYTVTRSFLRKITTIKITVLFCLYVISYIICFCYSELLFDPALVNYFYANPAGTALILIKLIFGWIWFCYAIGFTLKHYPEKKKFYIAFSIVYTLWFWVSPILVFVSNYALDLQIREKASFIAQASVGVVGYTFFLILTSPISANHIFPYHASTNQIGDVDYPHHSEDGGGNKLFANDALESRNQMYLSNLFSADNTPRQDKY